jgi:hypothetical protein
MTETMQACTVHGRDDAARINGTRQYFPGDWCRTLQAHRIWRNGDCEAWGAENRTVAMLEGVQSTNIA